MNADRLSGAYDIYESLLDIAYENFGSVDRKAFKNRGQSLFRLIDVAVD